MSPIGQKILCGHNDCTRLAVAGAGTDERHCDVHVPRTPTQKRAAAFGAVSLERDRQEVKAWDHRHIGWVSCAHPDMDPLAKLAVLVEEVGEVARALNDREPVEALEAELVQVAAVAVAWIESLNVRHDVPCAPAVEEGHRRSPRTEETGDLSSVGRSSQSGAAGMPPAPPERPVPARLCVCGYVPTLGRLAACDYVRCPARAVEAGGVPQVSPRHSSPCVGEGRQGSGDRFPPASTAPRLERACRGDDAYCDPCREHGRCLGYEPQARPNPYPYSSDREGVQGVTAEERQVAGSVARGRDLLQRARERPADPMERPGRVE